MALKHGVLIIEGVPQYENSNEGRILFEFLNMVIPDKVELYYDIRSREEFNSSIEENKHKFIHISSHGDVDATGKVFLSFPRNMQIYPEDFVQLKGLQSRNVLITACEAGKSNFIYKLYKNTSIASVIAPRRDILFAESAMWCINYYYHLFKFNLNVHKTFSYMRRKFHVKGAFTKRPRRLQQIFKKKK